MFPDPWKVTRAAFNAASKLLHVQLRGAGDEGDDANAEPADDAVVLQQLGLAVLPIIQNAATSTLRALGFQHGDEVRVLAWWDKARSPADLEAGETQLYAVGAITHVLRLLTSGAVLEAPSIKLGAAATKKVNREGDPLRPGTLGISATSSTLTITYTAPDGGGTQSVSIVVGGSPAVFTPVSGTITLAGKTGPGSNKVLAEH